MSELRKYGVSTTFVFPVIKADVPDFAITGDWTPVAADGKLSKDGANVASLTNAVVAIGGTGSALWKVTLTATEMQFAYGIIQIIDPAIEDQAIVIETYGNASAQHAFDLDTAEQQVDLVNWRGNQPTNLNATGHVLADVRRWHDVSPDVLTSGKVNVDLELLRGSVPNVLVSGRVDASVGAVATAARDEIADRVLDRPISNVETPATFRSLYGAIAALVNRRRINGGNLEVFETDDATLAETFVRTEDSGLDPTGELDP